VDVTIPLYDSKQRYTIGTNGNKSIDRPLKASQARRLLSDGQESPIWVVSRQEYMEQPVKSTNGVPNMVYYDPQLDLGVLYVWPTSSATSVELSDGSTDLWTLSGSGTGEYYYTGSAITAEPSYVFGGVDTDDSLGRPSTSETELVEGTLGSLNADEWAWGDNDSLGSNTLYVRLSEGDPDAQASGFVKALTSTPGRVIVTFQFPLQDFDLTSNNPDFPVEWNQGLVYCLAEVLSPMYGQPVRTDIAAEAQRFKRALYAHDTEPASLSVAPSYRGYNT